MSSFTKDVLYDLPVSNHGGRVRFLIYAKGLKEQVPVVSPIEAFGGIKTAEYLAVSPQGKMPALLADDGRFPLCESDTICRYIMQKYNDVGPSFYPSHPMQLALSEQLTRLLDIYVGSIQGCVYKAPGSVFGSFGTDRKAAFAELKKQLLGMEQLLDKFASTYPDLTGDYLCGTELSLADASVFASMVFFDFMIPQFFGGRREEYMGPRMLKWWSFMCSSVPAAQALKAEMEEPLNGWKSKGRWDPIIEEMKQVNA